MGRRFFCAKMTAIMAHWDAERDRKRVEEMRQCEAVDLKYLIDKYETTGDDIYWAEFVDALRREARK